MRMNAAASIFGYGPPDHALFIVRSTKPSEAEGAPAWMRDALCKKHSEISFLPTGGEPSLPANFVTLDAQVVCNAGSACPLVRLAPSARLPTSYSRTRSTRTLW